MDALHEAHRSAQPLSGYSLGASVLAHAGLLDHRRATTHWMHIHDHGPLSHRRPRPVYALRGRTAVIHLSRFLGGRRPLPGARPPRFRRHGRQRSRPAHRHSPAPRRRPGPISPVAYAGAPGPRPSRRSRVRLKLTSRPDHRHQPHPTARPQPTTLIRRFHDTVGMTPRQWLLSAVAPRPGPPRNHRHSRGARPERSGIGSAANLRHQFGAHVGVSPLTFRRTFANPAFASK